MGHCRVIVGRPQRAKKNSLATSQRARPCSPRARTASMIPNHELTMSAATILTDRFDRALLYATHVHGGQVRKGTSTPYVAHLLAVAATVLEYGGDEDLAIAAL